VNLFHVYCYRTSSHMRQRRMFSRWEMERFRYSIQ